MASKLTQADIDRLIAVYQKTGSCKRTARTMGVSEYRARRILISAGICSQYSAAIAVAAKRGLTVAEIAQIRGVSVKAVQAHLPYIRCAYRTESRNDAKNGGED